jgi:hypothetical protein
VPELEHTALLNALDADVVRAHESYLDRRGRLLAIVDACDRFVVRTSRSHKAVHSVLTLVRKPADPSRRRFTARRLRCRLSDSFGLRGRHTVS